jgi:uncharacterized protein (TIGR02145 family)
MKIDNNKKAMFKLILPMAVLFLSISCVNNVKNEKQDTSTNKQVSKGQVSSDKVDTYSLIDGYKSIKIGDQIWMAEDLNIDLGEESYCYDDDANCNYGRLYTWNAAAKACPEGWHMPSIEEWRTLAKNYGGCDEDATDDGKSAYKALRQKGGNGFSARLGGFRNSITKKFDGLGVFGTYWSSTEDDERFAHNFFFSNKYGEGALVKSSFHKSDALSCRCIKD